MTRTVELLARHWVWLLALMAGITVMGFVFLRPENLVTEHCSIEGFGCRAGLSHSSSALSIELENLNGEGVMVESVAAEGSNINCRKEFDDGWGPFVSGRHMGRGGREEFVVECRGISAGDISSGNRQLRVVVKWYFENGSRAASRSSEGIIFSDVSP